MDSALETTRKFYASVIEGDRKTAHEIMGSCFPGSADVELRLQSILNALTSHRSVEQTKEALLLSIAVGNRQLVELVLSLFVDFPFEERSGCTSSVMFAPHVTPLVLACTMNDFAIVECLLERGHTIEIPHLKTCDCELCKKIPLYSRTSNRIIDVMRAVTSEAFLWLHTDDVLAACCSVVKDLHVMMEKDSYEFMEIYHDLELNVQKFMGKLAEQIWTPHEFSTIMANKNHCKLRDCETVYPRLQMALCSSMRQFIANTNVQMSMRSVWLGRWSNFGANKMRDASRCVRHVLLFPLLAFVYMFTSGRFAASFDIPMARFMSHTASYASFLGAVVAYRLLSENTFIGSICEFYVFTYIMGLALERYLMFTRLGFKQYFSFWWRWFDFVLLGAFGVAFFFRIEAFLVTRPYFLHTISRVHWSAFEYVIYYEIFLTAGYILSVWKMFYYFQLLKRLGVSVMTVGRCVGKLFNYLLLMGIVMVSFAVGLNMLMKPLVLQSSASSHYAFESSADFRIPWAVKSLYWSFYGYLDPISYKVAGSGGGGNLLPVSNIAAELFVGFYHVAIIIVLLNLITALLVKTADEIQENEEMEYKYTRVVIYSEFLTWEMSLPPPFNLIYVPLSFISRSVKSAYVLGWPELVMQRDCCDGSEEDTEMFTYYQVLKRMYYRFRAGKDINYRPAVKQESELDEEKLGIIMLMNTLETSTAGTANVDTKEEPFKRRRIRKLE